MQINLFLTIMQNLYHYIILILIYIIFTILIFNHIVFKKNHLFQNQILYPYLSQNYFLNSHQLNYKYFLMTQNTSPQKPIQLVYWNIRGIAQPIRHLLQYLKINYKQTKCICPHKWFNQDLDQIRKKCLFPTLPFINDDDFILSQVVAISKYLCKKSGRSQLLGKTIEDQAKVDQYLAKFVIHRNKLSQIFKKDFLQGSDDRLKKQKLNNLYIDLMSNQYMPALIKQLNEHEWILGYLTIADFFAYESIFYLTGIYSQKMSQFKSLYNFKQNFQSIEEIKQYNNSQRVMLKTFMSPSYNIWKGDSRYF